MKLQLVIPIAVGLSFFGEFQVDAQSFHCAGTSHYWDESTSPLATAKQVQPYSPAHGHLNTLVIFAQFLGETSGPSRMPNYAATLLDRDLPGSFAHFYYTMSSAQLVVEGTILPKRYTADQLALAYLASEPTVHGNYGQFVLEILRQVDRDVDLGLFDNDGPDGLPNSGDDDGHVDYIFINMLSTPRNFILGPSTGIAGLGIEEYISPDVAATGDGIRISGFKSHGALGQEGANLAQVVGTMAHEFGHSLGLPDLYDTSHLRDPGQEPAEGSAGIGSWGLMGWGAQGWNGAEGPNSFCAWSLEKLGWIGPNNERLIEIKEDTQGLRIADLHQGGAIYKVGLPPISLTIYESGKQGYTIQEPYLLLEYRAYDAHYYRRNLPAEGLLVWQIQPHSGNNVQEENKRVDLVCADGLYTDAGYPQGRFPDAAKGKDNLDFWAHDAAYTAAHQGNMGDATDMFDGVCYRRLTLSSNPALRSVSAACTGVAIESMRRQNHGMVADITLPQWAGTIREFVYWKGDVHVTGDVTVGPEGTLLMLENTQIHVDGQDRLQGGRDPARCEIYLKGQVLVFHPNYYTPGAVYIWKDYVRPAESVVFQAALPGEKWYGLVVDPALSIQLKLPDNSFELHDAIHGLVMADAPQGAEGLTLSGYTLIGDPSKGDDESNNRPLAWGETFQLAVELAAWSLTSYEDVWAKLQWNSPLVSPVQQSSSRSISSELFSLFPGQEVVIPLPSLALRQETAGEQQLDFTLQLLQGRIPVWQDSMVVAIFHGDVPTAVVAGEAEEFDELALWPNFPNPFNQSTTFTYTLPGSRQLESQALRLTIYNTSGQRIRTLVDGPQAYGRHQINWDGLDQQGRIVASGVYIARLHLGSFVRGRRLLLLK